MIKDLAEFTKFLKICRKQGVREVKLGDVSVTLGDLPVRKQGEDSEEDGEIPTEDLTPEQLMFFSAGGVPP